MPITTEAPEIRVTTRAMIDPSRKCSLRCRFCYYLPADDFYSVRDWPDVESDVLAAVARGCTHCDITGGEPLQYPDIVRLVRFCAIQGLRPRVITSLIGADRLIQQLLDNWIDDWLISMHGANEKTHNEIVNVTNARRFQVRRLAMIARRMRYCCNYVMVRANQSEIADWAEWITTREHDPPRIVNFINFNPHYGWQDMGAVFRGNIVDLRIVGPQLEAAIETLEAAGCGVNVRYFPMCALPEQYRRCVCNDRHVAFDSGEWDNAIHDRSVQSAYVYGLWLSHSIEEQGPPCLGCHIHHACGGANRIWHAASTSIYGEQLVPITLDEPLPSVAWMHYRVHNCRGFA